MTVEEFKEATIDAFTTLMFLIESGDLVPSEVNIDQDHSVVSFGRIFPGDISYTFHFRNTGAIDPVELNNN